MQKKLFSIGQQDLGDGQVLCQWSPRATWLAAAGNKVSTNSCTARHQLALQDASDIKV
jgi:hypothetical protein